MRRVPNDSNLSRHGPFFRPAGEIACFVLQQSATLTKEPLYWRVLLSSRSPGSRLGSPALRIALFITEALERRPNFSLRFPADELALTLAIARPEKWAASKGSCVARFIPCCTPFRYLVAYR